ncbi:MAG: thermonuclease family protein [Deltaproteobacteria bacterium]|jgi:micrococcal nuclease|nr:thermonuclease family protein [Deltaproteobacteria bacterium]
MKSFLFLSILVFALFPGCDDSASTNNSNNTNNTNNINNVNNTQPPEFMDFPAKVVSVSDGDTVRVLYQEQYIKIRLMGVDCPEIAHNGTSADPYGVEAMEFTENHMENGDWVGLEFDDDSCASENPPADCFDVYDRMLAYLRTDEDQDLGGQLLINGLATVYTSATFNRKTLYLQYQQEAIDSNRGLWSE